MQFIRFPKLPSYVLETYGQMTEPSVCGKAQPALLFGLSSLCGQKGAIVEIGSYIGTSTISLAAAQKEKKGCKVVAIDCSLHPNIHKNLERAGLSNWVELIEDFSCHVSKSWTKPIELLFIDGNHSYLATKNDLSSWAPFIVEGGYVALHDYSSCDYQGIHRAVYKVLLSKPEEWRVVSDRDTGSIIVLQRLHLRSIRHGFLHRLRYFLQLRESFSFLWARWFHRDIRNFGKSKLTKGKDKL